MANPLKSRRRDTLSKSDLEHILGYLFRPIELPSFKLDSSKFYARVSRALDAKLASALTATLPRSTLAVQFVYVRNGHDKYSRLGLDHPLLVKASSNNSGARMAADGLGYVTQLLSSSPSKSFHKRIREAGLTDAPAVAIFTNGQTRVTTPSLGALNVVHIQLPCATRPIAKALAASIPAKSISHVPASGSGIHRINLMDLINTDRYSDPRYLSSMRDGQRRATILHEVSAGQNRLGALAKDIEADSEYCSRVSYLLATADVIICTPHAYSLTPHHDDHTHDVAEAGLTVLLERTSNHSTIEEADWLRIQSVAQSLALFAGAAFAIEDQALMSITSRARDLVSHEYKNAKEVIERELEDLVRTEAPLKQSRYDALTARLDFTKVMMDTLLVRSFGGLRSLKGILNGFCDPLSRDPDLKLITHLDKIPSNFMIVEQWGSILGEVFRNAFKHGVPSTEDSSDSKITPITVSGFPDSENSSHIVVEISNPVEALHLLKLRTGGEGLRSITSYAQHLGGALEIQDRGGNTMCVRLVIPNEGR